MMASIINDINLPEANNINDFRTSFFNWRLRIQQILTKKLI